MSEANVIKRALASDSNIFNLNLFFNFMPSSRQSLIDVKEASEATPPSHNGIAPALRAGPYGHPGSTPGGGVETLGVPLHYAQN